MIRQVKDWESQVVSQLHPSIEAAFVNKSTPVVVCYASLTHPIGSARLKECIDVGWVEQRGTQQVQALLKDCIDVGWVEQRGTQQVQGLCWVTLRCTQPTILGVSIHCGALVGLRFATPNLQF